MAQKIRVEISTTGESTVTVTGTKGKGCLAATRDLEAALGTVKSDRKTGDYYQRPEEEKEKVSR